MEDGDQYFEYLKHDSHNIVYRCWRVDVLDIPGCTAYWPLSISEVYLGQVHWSMGMPMEKETDKVFFHFKFNSA